MEIDLDLPTVRIYGFSIYLEPANRQTCCIFGRCSGATKDDLPHAQLKSFGVLLLRAISPPRRTSCAGHRTGVRTPRPPRQAPLLEATALRSTSAPASRASASTPGQRKSTAWPSGGLDQFAGWCAWGFPGGLVSSFLAVRGLV